MIDSRTCFVVGDLHIGDGGVLDDFSGEAALADWLRSISGSGTLLVLNGDIVDFTGIEVKESRPLQRGVLWGEEVSTRKLALAIDAHPDVFAALGDYCQRSGQIVLVPGNHDPDWAWPRVIEMFEMHLGVPAGSVRVDDHVRFGRTHIEHGHSFTPENATPVEAPIVNRDGQAYLTSSWGSEFVACFFSSFRRDLPFAGRAMPLSRFLWLGFRHRWFQRCHLNALVRFLRQSPPPVLALVKAAISHGGSSHQIRAARDRVETNDVEFVVYGHTHLVLGADPNEDTTVLFNPGSWCPIIDLRSAEYRSAATSASELWELLVTSSETQTGGYAVEIRGSERPTIVHIPVPPEPGERPVLAVRN